DQRAVGVDAEIRVRVLRGPVVRRLRGDMDHKPDVVAVPREQGLDRLAIPDVRRPVGIIRQARFQLTPAPFGRRVVAEKLLPHVVLDADDLEPLRAEETYGLGAYQACRPRDDTYCHI